MITRYSVVGGGGVVYIGIVNFSPSSSLSMLHCPFCLDSGASEVIDKTTSMSQQRDFQVAATANTTLLPLQQPLSGTIYDCQQHIFFICL